MRKEKLALMTPQKLNADPKGPIVECVVTFMSGEDGGRATPPQMNGYMYRTLLQLEGFPEAELFGVLFQEGPSEVEFGVEAAVKLRPVVYPNPAYDALQPDASFVVREGHKVVGRGRVTRRSP